MRPSFLAVSVWLVSSAALAQGWHWVSPKPQGVAVNGLAFSGTTGWLVGATGSIAVTTDGAQTFTQQTSGVSVDLYGVFFQSATVGWAVGDLGTILATTNGGATWVPQTSGTTRLLRGVYFTDALHGLAVGDFRTLLATANGGETWTGLGTSALSLNAVTFTDAQHGFLCGDNGVVLTTVNGASSFSTVQTPTTAHLLALSFVDALHGFAVGEGGAVVATADGAQSFSSQTIATEDLVAVVANSSLQAYALGTSGNLYATADGATWAVVGQLMAGGLFTSLVQEPGGGAWDAAAQSGQWLRAPAGGTPPAFPVFADVNDLFSNAQNVAAVAFGSVDAGVMVAERYLYATQDRGRHIAQVGPAASDGGQAFGWNAVSMPSATDAYAVGIQGSVAISHDQGQTWTASNVGVDDDLEAVQFLPDSGTGYAVGASGAIASTVNGGATWTVLPAATTLTLSSLAFYDAQHGLVGGESGSLLYTLSGSGFQPGSGGLVGTVTGLAYPADGVALACSADGSLSHSTNQGLTFYSLAAPAVTQGFGALSFGSRQNGWLAGNSPQGNIWVTSDGAQSFGLQFSGSASLAAFSFVDATHGYAVGANGTVLATDTAGGPVCSSNGDCADAGYAGITCVAGACVPCTTDDRCGPSCTACPTGTPYCYGGYCGACENDSQCAPGFCVLGQCQESTPSDGGTTTTASSSTSGGASSGTTTGGHGSTTGACPQSDPNCNASSGCGCTSTRGAGVWGVALVVGLLFLRRKSAR